MKAIAPVVALIGALGLAVPALAEPTLAETVALQDTAAQQNGYILVSGPFNGSLSQGQAQRLRFLIVPGFDFAVVGACDQDCSDLDLRAYDHEGNEVTSDILDDATPELGLNTDNPAVVDLEVLMVTCRIAPCAFTVKVWGK